MKGPSADENVGNLDENSPRWGSEHVQTLRTLRLIKLLKIRKEPYDPDDITVVDSSMLKRAVGAAAVGNCMEWFDFGVYGYLVATIGKVFFPSGDTTAQALSGFAVFAAAFVVRPLGGLFFGPLGDKIGRQKVLAATMIMMAIGTFAVGFIPGYHTIGIWAPILLVLARLVQGFSTGGEYAGATTFIAEYSPDRKRGFFGSFLDFGTFIGYAIGSSLVTVLTAFLGDQTMVDWGWRIPFFIAGPIGIVGLYLRLKLEDTPAFRKKLDEHEHDVKTREKEGGARELKTIFVKQWKPMVICAGLVLLYNVTNYMVTSYLPTFMKSDLKMSTLVADMSVLVAMVTVIALIVVFGRLSDKIGRKPVFLMGAIAQIVLAIPCFMLIEDGGVVGPVIACIVLGVILTSFAAPTASTLPALFPTAVRYGALSIAFNVAVSAFGGTTALATGALVDVTGNKLMPAFYLIASGIVGLVAVLFFRENATQPLDGSPPLVGDEPEADKLATASVDLVSVAAGDPDGESGDRGSTD